VQAIFGIHSTPLFPAGEIAVQEGAVTAAVDHFAVTFTGKGAHAAHPDSGIDPIVAAASFVSSVQSIVSRNVDPFAANLVSITHFASGSTWNVIPETAFLEGTVRTMTAKDRQDVRNRLYALADHIARAYGATAAIEWFSGPPATANDSAWTAIAQAEARQQGMVVRRLPPSLGGEDFAFYQEHIRGVFIHIGTGLSYSAHNPRFQVDPQVLLPAAAYMSGLALRGLKELNITSGSGKND
jgi:amidohydrolase